MRVYVALVFGSFPVYALDTDPANVAARVAAAIGVPVNAVAVRLAD